MLAEVGVLICKNGKVSSWTHIFVMIWLLGEWLLQKSGFCVVVPGIGNGRLSVQKRQTFRSFHSSVFQRAVRLLLSPEFPESLCLPNKKGKVCEYVYVPEPERDASPLDYPQVLSST